QTLGLKELLRVYIDHRIQVVTRRSRFRLARREERLHLIEGLLIAILDIDEVIQVIRTSDDSEQARARLRDVFDLSEVQAEYILELRLRRLTKFSRIELEAERDALKAEIAQLQELLGSEVLIRAQVARELEAAADAHGTPRRTMLMNAKPAATRPARGAPALDLQIADSPTVVILSTTGRAVRVDLTEGQELTVPARRSKHDAILATATSTTRGELGAITSTGRLLRFSPVDLPSVPPASVQLGAGVVLHDYLGIADKADRVVGLVRFDDDTPVALGTRQGVVKRIVPSTLPARPELEVIGLKPGDTVVGADSAPDGVELVFVTSDAQLLRFPASAVRPQGAPAGGMAGVNVSAAASVIHFGAAEGEDVVAVTISGADGVLPGTDAGRVKVSRFDEFPAKGRATGGVRAHAFLKGEDRLTLAWVGRGPALAVASDGAARALPEATAKRDGSGQPLDAVIGSIGRTLG
ncbi:MAG TPA: DNA gyrase subunit A, partial [Microbacterium sp.]|uniref:DNA gyrase subunit A n=1 Tax=Microbacterium sp. TaxID=51671 RepID=UPI002CEDF05B